MRPVYYTVAVNLKTGREHAISGDEKAALAQFDEAIAALRDVPPERTRDVLLAHAYLARYQTLALRDRNVALESLHLGVSYARSTRDPLARAIAEECLSGLGQAA
ncbi:MAG TPA: hypothetical protein VNT60_06840 [Deinococcales bacterium]|nr:hypothetical protein [Deinococcales bacterium]